MYTKVTQPIQPPMNGNYLVVIYFAVPLFFAYSSACFKESARLGEREDARQVLTITKVTQEVSCLLGSSDPLRTLGALRALKVRRGRVFEEHDEPHGYVFNNISTPLKGAG